MTFYNLEATMSQKKETVLITGANGLVARRLKDVLQDAYAVRFLTRKVSAPNTFEWDVKSGKVDLKAFENVDYIIHLAGAGIADKRWTKQRKQEILESRVDTLSLILKTLKEHRIKIKALISASAIGYYGAVSSDVIFNESSPSGNDFLSFVCKKWEHIALQFSNQSVSDRSVIFRFGVVLSNRGGAFPKMLTPIKLNVGAALGNGQQYMPWIHIEDLCNLIKYSLEKTSMNGIYNAVAPEHINNQEFTKQVASAYRKKIYLPNIPEFVVKLMFGRASVLLLKGSRVSAQKVLDTGFLFKYPKLLSALSNLKRVKIIPSSR